MATRKESIEIDITADGKDAADEFDKTSKAADKFKDGVDKASKGAALAAGGILAIGVASLESAKDAERATTTVNRVFGESSDKLHQFAADSAENVGISSREYESMAAAIGTSLVSMGVSTDDAATKTDQLLTVAGDMALALGTDVPAAADALSAGLRGEFDALSEFGVKVDDATIKAGLAAQGINGPEGMTQAAYDAAYQQELLNQVLGGASAVYGGYRDETDTTAEKQDNLTAKWDDAAVKLGQVLLPAVGWVADRLIELSDWITDNQDTITQWLPWLGAAAGAVWILNFALAANPVVLVTLAFLALLAVIYIFQDEIYEAGVYVDSFMSIMSNIFPGLGPAIYAFDLLTGQVQTLWDTMSNLIGVVTTLLDLLDRFASTNLTLPSVPVGPGGNSAGLFVEDAGLFAATAAAAPAIAGRAGLSSSPVIPAGAFAGGVTVINVTGALDPDAVARQIESLLRRRGRRTGPVIL